MINIQSINSSEDSNPLSRSIHSQSDSSASINQSLPSNSKSENNLDIRKLTWDDFQGVPPEDDPALAHTRWKIGYNYQVHHEADKIQVMVDVWCKIDPSSWTKDKKIDELLHHQQGHFYIGMICALEFKKRVQEFSFSKDYKQEISEIFNKTLQEYLEMENKYNIETLNMLNTAKQRQWDMKIMKQLNSLSKYT
ncbi:unnamed protein product (macronuclear) [Paramecium tetraurelia]|uniref:Uncharacterized protein n=1 Tax=Paramecium tetraurelia TaxID=5888 RepID=A0BEB1_PARTE|nr:uncharacterized protein GSPATT00027911001 [Paramecium tetraurelia]CAK56878.1 unnamed protein product [Paramecium tetraurelia]|eukprot:XP_001424276.1 hypothetical protein (macronuclear) [Paramecium tetraurelia strain d4-2]